jgi:hypothetical protein
MGWQGYFHIEINARVCTKTRRAAIRQGKNRRGTAGVASDFRGLNEHYPLRGPFGPSFGRSHSVRPSLFLTQSGRHAGSFRTEPSVHST